MMVEFLGSESVIAPLVLLLVLWTLPWKGWALWIAARNRHTWWFIALLAINTVAILDIIYIFAVGRPALKKKEQRVETL